MVRYTEQTAVGDHSATVPRRIDRRVIPDSPARPMFIDEAKIRVKAGDGGNGCMAFRREKFVPRGGPSGGDGGRGGDVIMESSQRHNTLIHFRYNPEHKAQRGEHGMGSNCTGLDGRSIYAAGSGGHVALRRRDRRAGARLSASRTSAS